MSVAFRGTVVGCGRNVIDVRCPLAQLGNRMRIVRRDGSALECDVVGASEGIVRLAPLGDASGVSLGDTVVDETPLVPVLGTGLLGRALDAHGVALDGKPIVVERAQRSLEPISPERRRRSSEPLWTGVRAIDAFTTIARGARIGLFGPAGTGKSTLLSAIAAYAQADAVVIASIGERGRESAALLRTLDARTTIVCAGSDRTPAERVAAAELALAQGEALRDRGLHVLAIVDSLARYANAIREIDISLGEPAGRGGYPPGVFTRVARLVERAGCVAGGSLTLIATVLSDGGDDPLAEAIRSLLDGHLVLSRPVAERGRFPALDIPAGLSRLMADVAGPDHLRQAAAVRTALAWLEESREARALGISAPCEVLERAVRAEAACERFLEQGREGGSPPAQTLRTLADLADSI